MPISKKRKLNINKKIKTQKGGARRTIKQTTPLPDVPILPPGLSFPKVPMSDPGLKLANDQCYNASQNIRDLQAKIDQEKRDVQTGKKKTAELCSYFNTYITQLKKHNFYNAIYIETFAPPVPTQKLPV
jgi:hypothetical protein